MDAAFDAGQVLQAVGPQPHADEDLPLGAADLAGPVDRDDPAAGGGGAVGGVQGLQVDDEGVDVRVVAAGGVVLDHDAAAEEHPHARLVPEAAALVGGEVAGDGAPVDGDLLGGAVVAVAGDVQPAAVARGAVPRAAGGAGDVAVRVAGAAEGDVGQAGVAGDDLDAAAGPVGRVGGDDGVAHGERPGRGQDAAAGAGVAGRVVAGDLRVGDQEHAAVAVDAAAAGVRVVPFGHVAADDGAAADDHPAALGVPESAALGGGPVVVDGAAEDEDAGREGGVQAAAVAGGAAGVRVAGRGVGVEFDVPQGEAAVADLDAAAGAARGVAGDRGVPHEREPVGRQDAAAAAGALHGGVALDDAFEDQQRAAVVVEAAAAAAHLPAVGGVAGDLRAADLHRRAGVVPERAALGGGEVAGGDGVADHHAVAVGDVQGAAVARRAGGAGLVGAGHVGVVRVAKGAEAAALQFDGPAGPRGGVAGVRGAAGADVAASDVDRAAAAGGVVVAGRGVVRERAVEDEQPPAVGEDRAAVGGRVALEGHAPQHQLRVAVLVDRPAVPVGRPAREGDVLDDGALAVGRLRHVEQPRRAVTGDRHVAAAVDQQGPAVPDAQLAGEGDRGDGVGKGDPVGTVRVPGRGVAEGGVGGGGDDGLSEADRAVEGAVAVAGPVRHRVDDVGRQQGAVLKGLTERRGGGGRRPARGPDDAADRCRRSAVERAAADGPEAAELIGEGGETNQERPSRGEASRQKLPSRNDRQRRSGGPTLDSPPQQLPAKTYASRIIRGPNRRRNLTGPPAGRPARWRPPSSPRAAPAPRSRPPPTAPPGPPRGSGTRTPPPPPRSAAAR